MNHRILRAALFALALSPAALADVPFVALGDIVSAPTRPEAPTEMSARVAVLAGVAADFTGKCRHGRERNPRPRDPRCEGWLAKLRKGGDAGVYAIGAHLAKDSNEFQFAPDIAHSLVGVLGDIGSPVAVQHLVHRLHTIGIEGKVAFWGEVEMLDGALRKITGASFSLTAPWLGSDDSDDQTKARHATVARQWNGWWGTHAAESRTTWQALGLIAAREALGSSDFVARYAAVSSLLDVTAERDAAVKALRATLADEATPAEVKSAFSDLATYRSIASDEIPAAQLDSRN